MKHELEVAVTWDYEANNKRWCPAMEDFKAIRTKLMETIDPINPPKDVECMGYTLRADRVTQVIEVGSVRTSVTYAIQ